MKKLIPLVTSALLLSLGGYCNATPVEAASATADRTSLTIYSDQEPVTLDLDVSVSTAIMFRNLYTNLYRINSNNQIVPELAEDYSVNDDFTEYTFTLKENGGFSDGTPITAEDVKFTYERGIELGIDYFDVIKSVDAPDERTVVITLAEPNNSFLTDMASEHMAVMSKAALESDMDVVNCPTITSGAYYVDHWDKENHQIFLKANPYFVEGEPAIQDVTVLFKLDETIYDAMLDGTIDYATNIPNDSDAIPYLKAADGIDLMPYDNNSWNFISLNQLRPELADDNVRRAIASALDLDYIIGSSLDGQGTPAPLIITGSISGYLPGFNDSPFDMKKAKEYMAASAYPEGFSMTFEIGDTSGAKVAEVVKTLLHEIGIEVEIIEEDSNDLVNNVLEGNYDASFLSYSMYSGHISHAIPLFSDDDLHLSNGNDTKIGELMKQSLAADEEERDALLSEAYTMMRDLWPYIGLYWTTVHDAKVEGLQLTEPVASEKYILSNMYWE